MREHLHLSMRTLDGAEFANAVYIDDIQAALDFLGVSKNITKWNVEHGVINIDNVMASIGKDQLGMYAGSPGLVVMLARCDDDSNCHSATWN